MQFSLSVNDIFAQSGLFVDSGLKILSESVDISLQALLLIKYNPCTYYWFVFSYALHPIFCTSLCVCSTSCFCVYYLASQEEGILYYMENKVFVRNVIENMI